MSEWILDGSRAHDGARDAHGHYTRDTRIEVVGEALEVHCTGCAGLDNVDASVDVPLAALFAVLQAAGYEVRKPQQGPCTS